MSKIKKFFICFILFSILILFVIILYSYYNGRNLNNLNIKSNIFYPYEYFKNINSKDILFRNREFLIISEGNFVIIGRNRKELENGYYDLKLDINKDNIYLIINNLQKDDIDFKSISDEYINELKEFLSILLNNKNLDEIMDVIKKEYINLRNNNLYVENKTSYNQININGYIIVFNIENNMLKIDIRNMG